MGISTKEITKITFVHEICYFCDFIIQKLQQLAGELLRRIGLDKKGYWKVKPS